MTGDALRSMALHWILLIQYDDALYDTATIRFDAFIIAISLRDMMAASERYRMIS